jgi:hypothetical protein
MDRFHGPNCHINEREKWRHKGVRSVSQENSAARSRRRTLPIVILWYRGACGSRMGQRAVTISANQGQRRSSSLRGWPSGNEQLRLSPARQIPGLGSGSVRLALAVILRSADDNAAALAQCIKGGFKHCLEFPFFLLPIVFSPQSCARIRRSGCHTPGREKWRHKGATPYFALNG